MGNTCCPQTRSKDDNNGSFNVCMNEAEMNMSELDRVLKFKTMFDRPMSKGNARDAVRLLSRVKVLGPSKHQDTQKNDITVININNENLLYKVAFEVASLFEAEEQEKVFRVSKELKDTHGALDTAQPNALLDLTSAFFDKLGKDCSPVCRVFKLFHQKYILEAVCALKFQGGLLNVTTRDLKWDIHISKKESQQTNKTKIIVKHIRTEIIITSDEAKNINAFNHKNMNIPTIKYELELVFNEIFDLLLKARLSILEIDDKGTSIKYLPKEIMNIKNHLMLTKKAINIFESTTNV